ncbi:MAG TPA: formate dehydrogenase accessory sulfurtransferase FdhD [Desulfuromonadales bacterium]|nr:formate dehydrogenase accessory sulfurtransferase FdhD [Desulfuromonadales bacterium]
MNTLYTYHNGRLEEQRGEVVREHPLALTVNGRELATLVASPHELRFLVAGFLRLQGFVESLDDFLLLSVCDDFGVANVRIKQELPERLRPVLTSGCGTGITFDLPSPEGRGEALPRPAPVRPDAVFRLMEELAKKAEGYRSHGGIHSAAVGEPDGTLLLFAEDLGRHNTLDRIAGEALFKGIDLAGKLLVTSGRVSTEMAAKAARLGLALIASRTSATDQAVRLCEEAGIGLVGYVRGGKFTVYAHPQQLDIGAGRIRGVTGVILAGGESRRMGSDKSLLPLDGGRFIDHAYRTLAALFDEVLIVTNSPDLYAGLPCRKVPDLYPLKGSLAGIHSALSHARTGKIFVVACDMPFLSAEVIRRLCARDAAADVVIPRSERGVEPLHALYDTRCLPAVEELLDAGEKKIVRFFPRVRVCEVPPAAFADCDPEGRSFRNINTPQEYFALRDGDREEPAAAAEPAPAGRQQG